MKTTFFRPSLYGGRFTRGQYWLHLIVVMLLTQPVCYAVGSSLWGFVGDVLMNFFLFLPIYAKRARDIGWSFSVPVVFTTILTLLNGLTYVLNISSEKHGVSILTLLNGLTYVLMAHPELMNAMMNWGAMLLLLALTLAVFVMLVVMGCLRSKV